LPETRGRRLLVRSSENESVERSSAVESNPTGDTKVTSDSRVKDDDSGASVPVRPAEQRMRILKSLRILHCLFLGVFSGVEFTLTFLTFDLFDWNNTQNGKLIGSIGIISAVLQGGYVRRALTRVGELRMAQRGTTSCAIGLVALALVPHFTHTRPRSAFRLLQGAAVCMAFTSATVVNALTAHASLQCDEAPEGAAQQGGKSLKATQRPELAKGQALGRFRSSGQLGRAIGPLLACASYWTLGPSVTYTICSVAMTVLSLHMRRVIVAYQTAPKKTA